MDGRLSLECGEGPGNHQGQGFHPSILDALKRGRLRYQLSYLSSQGNGSAVRHRVDSIRLYDPQNHRISSQARIRSTDYLCTMRSSIGQLFKVRKASCVPLSRGLIQSAIHLPPTQKSSPASWRPIAPTKRRTQTVSSNSSRF